MKRLNLLPLFLILTFFACTRKSELLTYKDLLYPFSFKYWDKKMQIETYNENRKDKEYWALLQVDLSHEFPKEREPGQPSDLYAVIAGTYQNDFKGYPKAIFEVTEEETDFNGIPAIVRKDAKGRPRSYILFTPGVYAHLWLAGVDSRSNNPDEISQEFSDRREQLTYEMIKHFKWEQKIDTNSEEFKKWKAHILKILSESSQTTQ